MEGSTRGHLRAPTATAQGSTLGFGGVLHKKGRVNKAWKSRYMALDTCEHGGRTLRYFVSVEDAPFPALAKGEVVVTGVVDVPGMGEGRPGHMSHRLDALCEGGRVRAQLCVCECAWERETHKVCVCVCMRQRERAAHARARVCVNRCMHPTVTLT